jgi:hypothetical protein
VGRPSLRVTAQPTQHFVLNAKEINPLWALHFEEIALLHLTRHLRITPRLRWPERTRFTTLRVLGVVAFGALLCGCSQTFADQIREHRGCIGEALIAPQRVDACLRNTDGRRQNVNICLVDDMVPDSNIRMLSDCVDAAEHSRNY